jgi:hypothetical protein
MLKHLALGHMRRGLLETGVLTCQEPLDSLAQILQQVPAVGHLHRVWRAFASPFGVFGRAVAGDDLDAWMRLEPRRERCWFSVR